MINNLLDGLKGIGKFLGVAFYLIGYLPYTIGKFLMNIKFSPEIAAELSMKKEEEKKIQEIELSKLVVTTKRAPRKKKVNLETFSPNNDNIEMK